MRTRSVPRVRASRAENRWQRKRAICRKRGIVMRAYSKDYIAGMTVQFCGRLAKGKIHCSCPMCRRKSWERPSMQLRRQRVIFHDQMREWQYVNADG